MKFFLIILLVVVVIALAAMGMYNGLIKLRNIVQESWRQIDVELTRRHDLIPNLVETVKGYAAHEKDTLQAVIAARTQAVAPGASPAQQAQHENALSQTLGRLFAVSEAYPDLKANANFMQLHADLSETEDRIAASRRYYNANVRLLNTKVESVPTNIIAHSFGITKAEYFETDDPAVRAAPTVSFGSGATSSAPAAAPANPVVPAPGQPPVADIQDSTP